METKKRIPAVQSPSIFPKIKGRGDFGLKPKKKGKKDEKDRKQPTPAGGPGREYRGGQGERKKSPQKELNRRRTNGPVRSQ